MFFLVCIDILPHNFFLIALFFPSAESPLPIGGAARHFFPSVESVLHIDDILIGLCLSSHCSCHSLASVPYIFHFTLKSCSSTLNLAGTLFSPFCSAYESQKLKLQCFIHWMYNCRSAVHFCNITSADLHWQFVTHGIWLWNETAL